MSPDVEEEGIKSASLWRERGRVSVAGSLPPRFCKRAYEVLTGLLSPGAVSPDVEEGMKSAKLWGHGDG